MPAPEQPIHSEDAARGVVHAALADVEILLPPGTVLDRDVESPLAAPDGPLESLGLVNLVVALENHAFPGGPGGTAFMDALALPLEESPFRTVGSLERFVRTTLEGSGD
jgi:hypothetical protein